MGHRRWFHNQFPPFFPCSPLPSWTWRTPGLSIPWCCLPTSSSVCLVFFPLSLCLARWFWPHLMNERHDHTLQFASLYDRQEIFVWSDCLLPMSNQTSRRDHQNDETLGWPIWGVVSVSTVVGNKVTKTVSKMKTTVENNWRYSERELPSPPWTHSPVSSLLCLLRMAAAVVRLQ